MKRRAGIICRLYELLELAGQLFVRKRMCVRGWKGLTEPIVAEASTFQGQATRDLWWRTLLGNVLNMTSSAATADESRKA